MKFDRPESLAEVLADLRERYELAAKNADAEIADLTQLIESANERKADYERLVREIDAR